MGLHNTFDVVEAGSPSGGIKPESMRRVLAEWQFPVRAIAAVGDAPSDIRSAREIGARPLGAAWAATSHYETLAALEPEAVFRSVGEFQGWIEKELARDGFRTPTSTG
jgi:phosphoglycolate phosphatase/pyrophosphatase PpaX